MLETIKYIVGQFAEKPELIDYDYIEEDSVVKVVMTLDKSDMGKVIGRQGKLAKALRTIMKVIAQKDNKKIKTNI